MKAGYYHRLCGSALCRMSSSGRSLLLLLQRCVTGRQTRLLSGFRVVGSWSSHRCCHLLQQQTRTTLYLQRSFQPSPVLKLSHLGLCTKVSLHFGLHGPTLASSVIQPSKDRTSYWQMLFLCRPEHHGRRSTHPCQPTSQNQTRRRFTLCK